MSNPFGGQTASGTGGGYGSYKYQSPEARALGSITPSSYDYEDQGALLSKMTGDISYMAAYMKKMQTGIDQANQNVIQQIQGLIQEMILLLGGGGDTQFDFGDLKYIFQAWGALFGLHSGETNPIDLFQAAWHFISNYVVPTDNFQELFDTLIDRAIATILTTFGDTPILGEGLEQLAEILSVFRDKIDPMFHALATIKDTLGLPSIDGSDWDAFWGSFSPIANFIKSVFEPLLPDGLDGGLIGIYQQINGWGEPVAELVKRVVEGFSNILENLDLVSAPLDDIGAFFGNLWALLDNLTFSDGDFDAIEGWAQILTDKLGPAGAALDSVLQTLITKVQQIIDMLFDAFGGTSGSLNKTITQLQTNVVNFLNNAATNFGDLSTLKTNFQTLLNNLFDGFGGTSGSVGKTIANVLTNLQSFFGGVGTLPGLFSTLQTNFDNLLNNLFDGFGGTSGSTGKTIANVLTNLQAFFASLGTLSTNLSGLSTNFQTLLNNLFDGFGGTTGSVGKTLANVLTIAQSFFSNFGSVSSTLSTLGSNFQTLLNNLWDGFGGTSGASGKTIANVLTNLQSFFGSLGTLSTNFSGLSTNFQTLLNNLFDGFGGTTGSSSKTLSQVLTILQTMFGNLGGAISNISTITTNFNTLLNNLWDGFNGTTGAAGKTIANVFTNAQSFYTVVSGHTGSISTLNTNFQTLLNNLWDAFNGTTGSSGKNLANLLSIAQTLYANTVTALAGLVSSTTGATVLSDIGTILSSNGVNLQGMIDGAINAFTNGGLTGQSFSDFEANASTFITNIYNKFTGSHVSRATAAQAASGMQSLANTVTQTSSALAVLQGQLSGSNGLAVSVSFKDPDIQTFNASGSWTKPSWFTLGVDPVDAIQIPGGGGGDGAGVGHGIGSTGGNSSVAYTDSGGAHTNTTTTPGTHGTIDTNGRAANSVTYNGKTYNGGAAQGSSSTTGHAPGGGGAAALGAGAFGGNGATWGTPFTFIPTSATVTPTVGAGGARGTGVGGNGGAGGAGQVNLVSRQAVPSTFTSAGTLTGFPIWRYNVNQTYTDAQTVSGVWKGNEGGILICRMNSAGTQYVYVMFSDDGAGGTNYTIGYVSGGTNHSIKTGNVASTAPSLNAWSLISDSAYVYSFQLNSSIIDTWNDTGHLSTLGVSNRCGGFGYCDTTSNIFAPGTITTWQLLDSGTPSTITQVDGTATAIAVTSATYAALPTTPGPAVSVVVGQDGNLIIDYSAVCACPGGSSAWMSFALSGANTLAASDVWGAPVASATTVAVTAVVARRKVFTGLNPGTTIATAQYRRSSGTGSTTFQYPTIIADPR